MERFSVRVGKVAAVVVAAGVAAVAVISGPSRAADAGKAVPSPLQKLFDVCKASGGAIKFESAQSCSASNCHGGTAGKPLTFISAYTVYSDKDKHANAYDTLTKNPKSATIASALKIDKAETSEQCLSCHAINVPAGANADGQNAYQVSEGVSCDACHGPSTKWHSAHAAKDWTNQQRTAAGYQLNAVKVSDTFTITETTDHEFTGGAQDKLLQSQGLYDTKPVLARAETCTKCHLAIDSAMVDAGHPQPLFELAYYQAKEPKHWTDPTGYFTTKVWAAGQITCLRDAAKQLADRASDAKTSPDRLKEAYEIAESHIAMVSALLGTGAVKGDAATLDKAGAAIKDAYTSKANDKLAAAAGDVAKTYDDLAKASEDFKPDKASTLAIVNAIIAKPDLSKDFGRAAAQQQTYGTAYLWSAYAAAEKSDVKPDFKPLLGLAVNKNKEAKNVDDDFDADAFSKALATVAGTIPKS